MPQYVCVSTHPEHLSDGREAVPGDTVDLPADLSSHDAALIESGALLEAPQAKQAATSKKENKS